MAPIHMVGTSHYSPFDYVQAYDKARVPFYRSTYERIISVNSYPGLQMLEQQANEHFETRQRSDERTRQYRRMEDTISSMTGTMIFESLTNDCFSFLGRKKGTLLCIEKRAASIWSGMTAEKRSEFNLKELHLLPKVSEKFIKGKMALYVTEFSKLLQLSSLSNVIHMSLLERQYAWIDKVHLDILFTYMNQLLRRELNNTKFYNKIGKQVIVKFSNVSRYYHEAKEPSDIFREKEIEEWEQKGKLIHRSDEVMVNIMNNLYKLALKM